MVFKFGPDELLPQNALLQGIKICVTKIWGATEMEKGIRIARNRVLFGRHSACC
jgi:hypothetical protein